MIHPINQSYSICLSKCYFAYICVPFFFVIASILCANKFRTVAIVWCSGSAFPQFYRLFEASSTSRTTFRTGYGLESNSSLNSICGAVVYSQVDFCLDLWLCKRVFQQYYPISFNMKRSFYDMITDTLY